MEKEKFDIKFEESLKNSLKDILKIVGKEILEKIIQNNKKTIKNEPLINGFRIGHFKIEIIIDILYSQIVLKKQEFLKEEVKSIFRKIFLETQAQVLELKKDKNFNDNLYYIINKFKFKDNISLYLKFSDKNYGEDIEQNYKEYKQKSKERGLALEVKDKRNEIKAKDKEIKDIRKEHKENIVKLKKEIKTLKEEAEKTKEPLEFLKNEKLELEIKSNGIKKEIKNINLENKKLTKKISKAKIKEDINFLQNEENNINKRIGSLKKVEVELTDDIEILKKDEDNIIEELETEENRKNDLLKKGNELEKENDRLKESVDILNIEMGNFLDKFNSVFKNNCKNNKDDFSDEILVYQLEGKCNINLSGEGFDEIINKRNFIEDFMDDFLDNLENVGLKDDNVLLARYVYSILSSGENLLFVGYSSISVANALSNTVCSKNADIINIPMGFNNFKELINIVKNCKSEVVVINNILDVISENVYLPLLKLDTKKIVIFTMESEENLELISKYLYNYLVPIDIDTFIRPVIKKEFIKSNIDFSLLNLNIEKDNVKKYYKSLKEIKYLSNILKIKYANIFNFLNVIFKNENDKNFECFSKFTSKFILGDEDE